VKFLVAKESGSKSIRRLAPRVSLKDRCHAVLLPHLQCSRDHLLVCHIAHPTESAGRSRRGVLSVAVGASDRLQGDRTLCLLPASAVPRCDTPE
jgi:hypothetical protein